MSKLLCILIGYFILQITQNRSSVKCNFAGGGGGGGGGGRRR